MANPVDIQVGNQIRLHRQRKEISLSRLAIQIGATVDEVQGYEAGTSRAGAGDLVRIAEAFGISVGSLFDDTSEPETSNDNLPPFEILTKQGLALLKAFHGIRDAALRHRVLQMVEEMASGEKLSEPDSC